MDLQALVDFNLVARFQGFGLAARATGRAKATLSRRVAELEKNLNLQLFEPGPRGLKLTEEGRALYERTGALLNELDESMREIAQCQNNPKGRLRISAPVLFSQIAMGTLAGAFALQYPEVRLELTSEDREVDLVEEGYDLAIRTNPTPDERLAGRIFLRDRLVAVASSKIKQPTNRSSVPAILHGRDDQRTFWDVVGLTGRSRITIYPVAHMSSLIVIRDAVRLGLGVACLPMSLVSRDLAVGTLVSWGVVDGSELNYWAVYPSRRLLTARVSAFIEHLIGAFPLGGEPEELAAFIP